MSAVHMSAAQMSAVHMSAAHMSAPQMSTLISAVHISAVHMSAAQMSAVHMSAAHMSAPQMSTQISAVHMSAVHMSAAQMSAVHMSAMHMSAAQMSAVAHSRCYASALLWASGTFRQQLFKEGPQNNNIGQLEELLAIKISLFDHYGSGLTKPKIYKSKSRMLYTISIV
uniref:Ice-structuring protein 4-like n=1 Tax=Globodera pallida TaxID=36090 RepID=A0A183BNV8_GLOPA